MNEQVFNDESINDRIYGPHGRIALPTFRSMTRAGMGELRARDALYRLTTTGLRLVELKDLAAAGLGFNDYCGALCQRLKQYENSPKGVMLFATLVTLSIVDWRVGFGAWVVNAVVAMTYRWNCDAEDLR